MILISFSNSNSHLFEMSIKPSLKPVEAPILYAGPVSYYAQLIHLKSDFDIHENFTKQNFRSRTRIFGTNGVISLNIPVQKGAQDLPMSEVKISNFEAWQRTHWRTFVSAYKSSPFFEFYAYLFEPYFNRNYEKLIDFNLDIHRTILNCLQINANIQFTSKFNPIQKNDLRFDYSSKKSHPLSSSFPKYQQVFSYSQGFEPDLSVLDLLFNLGPETELYLNQTWKILSEKSN